MNANTPHTDTLAASLREALGADGVATPEDTDLSRHMHDFINSAPEGTRVIAAVYPRSTDEVSRALALCHQRGVPVFPQGGMTGLAGGGVPQGECIVLSMERMRAIEEVDTDAAAITVQAGIPLELVQNAADEVDMLFPLDLGGRGTAQVGGNAATNAGGNRVLRYGMMRDLVLGVEAVLADGTVICSLNKMLKNNAGYDIKQLFLGTEGTLGVITRLVLRLFPKPRSVCTGLVAVSDFDGLLELLRRSKSGFAATLSAFEAMWPEFYHLGTEALDRRPPIEPVHGVYVLLETMGTDADGDQQHFETVIGEAIEAGVVTDAVIAQSGREARSLWDIRDCPGEFPKIYWPQIGFDISVPIGEIGRFIERCRTDLQRRWPGIRTVFFGHIADSNLHLSVKGDPSLFSEHELDEVVYALVGEWKGSISAEHGIGSLKKPYLHHSRSEQELELMRTVKRALDPKGILNPGKVI